MDNTFCACGCNTVVILGAQIQGTLEDRHVYKNGELVYIELFVIGHKTAILLPAPPSKETL